MAFFGRENEMEDLEALWGKRSGSLITCRGRRRIGKSTLIEEFARKSKARFIKIEGVRPKPGHSNVTELAAFADQLAAQTRAEESVPTSWLKAFMRLDREINDKERTVVLLDEVSWLGHYDDTFADMVKIAWDNQWSKHDRLILAVCGSVSGWIKENFVDNGAFFGRRSLDIVLRELPLDVCIQFWGKSASRIDTREIVDVLSVTGGVPRYLKEINPGMSAADNLRRMAFRAQSILRDDFDEMFSDVITRQTTLAGRVVRRLVDGARSVSEIAEALGMEKGGKLSEALGQLEEAGLVASDPGKNPNTGVNSRERRYRLSDNYSRFYLKYIEPEKEVIDSGAYKFISLEGLEEWDVMMGFQFENLVLNNYRQLMGPLHIGNAVIESIAPYRRGKSAGRDGVQIDVLVQTKRNVYVVEVKRQANIGKDVIAEVEAKIKRLGKVKGRSIRPVLVYEGNLAASVETDGYFDVIIPFRKLLGM